MKLDVSMPRMWNAKPTRGETIYHNRVLYVSPRGAAAQEVRLLRCHRALRGADISGAGTAGTICSAITFRGEPGKKQLLSD